MTRIADVRTQVLSLLPALSGWKIYTDGVATGKLPPWVVVSFTEKSRAFSEARLQAMSHEGSLTIRVVGASEAGVNICCDNLTTALDGARTNDPRISTLIADSDSGTYLSDLTNPDTSSPYVMRVLAWRLTWTN